MAAVGAITLTEQVTGTVKKVTFAWTSDAAGIVSGIPTTAFFSGAIDRLVTVPSGGGTAPTALYDIVINDDDGTDVLMGSGANRSATATEQVLASSLGYMANSKLTLGITNAGASKQGTIYLYIR